MQPSVIDLREFYDTLQGRVVQRALRQHLKHFWPSQSGLRIASVGYGLPYLRPLMPQAERVIALMPRQQGATFWPSDEKGIVALCDETELPIETNSIDRLLIVHSGPHLEDLLREAWRVLKAQGSVILIVPNRAGLWARFDTTPFGSGVPYSMGQLKHTLKDHLFIPERSARALFMPPTDSRLMLAAAPVWEKIGSRFFNAFGGVNIVEATKQLYAGTPVGAVQNAEAARRRFQAAPKPLSRASD